MAARGEMRKKGKKIPAEIRMMIYNKSDSLQIFFSFGNGGGGKREGGEKGREKGERGESLETKAQGELHADR